MSNQIKYSNKGADRIQSTVNPSKVPEVTLGFWTLKILATTLGEVGGNAVTMTLGLGYLVGTVIFAPLLMVVVIAQVRAKGFHPLLYWSVITLTTLTGTTLADFVDRSLGIGYLGGSLTLFFLVIATLAIWYRSMGTVDVVSITSRKAEVFYWTTIMFSQTLGTALGDWMADTTGLGYNGSALLIAVLLVLLAGLYFCTRINRTFLFWAAFILTRPLGATFANSLDKPISKGGLAINDILATAVIGAIMLICLLLIPQRQKHASRL